MTTAVDLYGLDYLPVTDHAAIELTGEEIRKLRNAAGLTQKELAAAVGVSERTVANWEGGHTHPRFTKQTIALVRALQPTWLPAPERFLHPFATELSEDRSIGVINRHGEAPLVFRTKLLPRTHPEKRRPA